MLTVVFVLAGCQKPPADEMTKAAEALNRAENDVNAVTYAQNTLDRAREALKNMQSEADLKRYDSAKTFAADVVTYAERAINEGLTAEGLIKDEATNLVNGVQGLLAEAETSLNSAKVNNVQADFNDLSQTLDTAKQDFKNAQNSLAASNFQDAINRSQIIRSTISDITAKISAAAQAMSRKK